MPNFRPGHDAHWIQTRLAFETKEGVEVVPLVVVDTEREGLVVHTREGERRYWSVRTVDVVTHLDRAFAVPGGHLVFLNESKDLLALPVGDADAREPQTMGLIATVTELEDGAAVAVATTEPGWWGRLYSLRSPEGSTEPHVA